MKKKLLICLLLSCFILTSCKQSGQNSVKTDEKPSGTAVSATTAQSGGELTLSEVENGTIIAPQGQKIFQLKNGTYEGGTGVNYAMIKILPQTALGDLKGDGHVEAAILLAENYGGSGVFVSLIAFQKNMNSIQQSPAILIDDRPSIKSLSITKGNVILDALIHGSNDSMASPSLEEIQTYRLEGDALQLSGLVQTENDLTQKITIDQPAENTAVSGSLTVKGSMPVAPFENNLRYRFYDRSGKVLSEGSMQVNSTGAGKPATINQSLTVPTMASGSKIRFELAYLSAKDGSIVCMTSIDLVGK